MKTEQIIWFIDSRFYFHASTLDKIVHLASTHHQKIKVIIDISAQITGRGYFHLFDDAKALSSELMLELDKKQKQLTQCFSMSAMKAEVIVNHSTNYLSVLNEAIANSVNSLVVIEDSVSSKRHALFQKLAEIQSPILIVNKKAWNSSLKLMAAVDPLHEHARSASLDENISMLTQAWAKSLKASWVVAHCYYVSSVLTKYKNKVLSMHREGLSTFAKKSRIPAERCILLEGVSEDALSSYIHKHHVNIIVIGLVARTKLEQLWVGSTTMALLGKIPCDMLLVHKKD